LACACFLLSCSQDNEKILNIGDEAPGFTLKDLDGNEISLSAYKGAPVILRFFLTDCKFCRADTPVFNKYYERYKSQGLKILYLDSVDMDRKTLAAFQQELQITCPIVLDMGGIVSKKYTVRALPQTIILNPQHRIVAAILGGVSEEELNSSLSPYLQPE
jgi:peroxiredoxin